MPLGRKQSAPLPFWRVTPQNTFDRHPPRKIEMDIKISVGVWMHLLHDDDRSQAEREGAMQADSLKSDKVIFRIVAKGADRLRKV